MRRLIFFISYFFINKNVLFKYFAIKKISKKSIEQIEEYKFQKMKLYLIDAYNNTVYYKELFDKINFNPYEFSDFNELKKIPLLNKNIIKSRIEDFYSLKKSNYKISKSGGSTGEPLIYRMGNDDSDWSRALLFNGFSYAGYKLGDSIINIAGGSIISKTPNFKTKLKNYILNTEAFYALDMDNNQYKALINRINKKQPKFIRGYASSIYKLAKYIEQNDLEILYIPKAIFTTSEVLNDKERILIEKIFNTKVYDQYGLNDSGASAFEIHRNKFLLDFERSYSELVKGNNQCKIITTSYSNSAMYFIRYDTGDNALISNEIINNKLVINKILGRKLGTVNYNGNDVSLPKLSILLSDLNIDRYQVIFDKSDITFLYSGLMSNRDKNLIKNTFNSLFKGSNLKICLVDEENFILTKNGKFNIFIIK